MMQRAAGAAVGGDAPATHARQPTARPAGSAADCRSGLSHGLRRAERGPADDRDRRAHRDDDPIEAAHSRRQVGQCRAGRSRLRAFSRLAGGDDRLPTSPSPARLARAPTQAATPHAPKRRPQSHLDDLIHSRYLGYGRLRSYAQPTVTASAIAAFGQWADELGEARLYLGHEFVGFVAGDLAGGYVTGARQLGCEHRQADGGASAA
jgi:hypothetical protein